MKAILLDIEGTTTPIDFVHRTLFPFARERVDAFVSEHFEDLTEEIAALVNESSADARYARPLDPTDAGSVSAYLKFLIDGDRKSTPLKSIQGMIWEKGYDAGQLVSEVYEDVPEAFKRWAAAGKVIAIYSSGSVLAQKLLFRYTDHGDLTPMISNYFDTNIGPKREPESYARIAAELQFEPAEIVFVSDIAAEVSAARIEGLRAALSVRRGNPPQHISADILEITSLTQIGD